MYADIANYDPSPDMQAMFDNVWNGEYNVDGQLGLAKENVPKCPSVQIFTDKCSNFR